MAEFLVQDTSLTAVADAIREKGGTTAPLSFPAGMAEAVRNIQSGADLSLDITGATPGQIAKISAVDTDGKPTQWEPVDIPSGGTDISLGITAATVGQIIKVKAVDAEGKPTEWEAVDISKPCGWELINEITIPEGADEILEFVINTDSNGKPFKLHRFMMFVHLPIYTGASEIPKFGFGNINGYRYNGKTYKAPLIYTSLSEPSKTTSYTFSWMEGDIMGDGNHMCIYGCYNPDFRDGGFTIPVGAGGVNNMAKFRYITGAPQSLFDVYRPITSVGLYNILMFAGCKVWLYGTKAQEDKA